MSVTMTEVMAPPSVKKCRFSDCSSSSAGQPAAVKKLKKTDGAAAGHLQCEEAPATRDSDESPRTSYWGLARGGGLSDRQLLGGDATPGRELTGQRTPGRSYVNVDERGGERTPGKPLFKTPKSAKKGRYFKTADSVSSASVSSGDRTPGRYLEQCSFNDYFRTPKRSTSFRRVESDGDDTSTTPDDDLQVVTDDEGQDVSMQEVDLEDDDPVSSGKKNAASRAKKTTRPFKQAAMCCCGVNDVIPTRPLDHDSDHQRKLLDVTPRKAHEATPAAAPSTST